MSELLAGAPGGVTRATRSEQLAALAATNAELSTLNRNLRHLATLLGQGSVRAAQEYRGMLATIAADVRRHLSLASALMAEMRSRRLPSTGAEQTSPTLSRGNLRRKIERVGRRRRSHPAGGPRHGSHLRLDLADQGRGAWQSSHTATSTKGQRCRCCNASSGSHGMVRDPRCAARVPRATPTAGSRPTSQVC